MTRESLAARRQRAAEIVRRLHRAYPASRISLDFQTPIQLLVAVILSAQCTDARVNLVTRRLFTSYRTVDEFADADRRALEKAIHSTGFFRSKARHVVGAARRMRDHYGGRLPDTMEDLLTLPGVGRKTANVLLWNAYGKNEGVAVDTHVQRISRLLGMTRWTTPGPIERDLLRILPRQEWGDFTHVVIDHGRAVCIARRPRCRNCVLNDLCPYGTRKLAAEQPLQRATAAALP